MLKGGGRKTVSIGPVGAEGTSVVAATTVEGVSGILGGIEVVRRGVGDTMIVVTTVVDLVADAEDGTLEDFAVLDREAEELALAVFEAALPGGFPFASGGGPLEP